LQKVDCRIGGHSTSDDPSRYRPGEHDQSGRTKDPEWVEKDPINRLRMFLEAKSLWTEAWETALRDGIQAENTAALEAVKLEPLPDRSTMFEDVYEDGGVMFDEERQTFLTETADIDPAGH
jgi:TPP-dependent pyruvate/acetoin dehydrogenase alpha subunit